VSGPQIQDGGGYEAQGAQPPADTLNRPYLAVHVSGDSRAEGAPQDLAWLRDYLKKVRPAQHYARMYDVDWEDISRNCETVAEHLWGEHTEDGILISTLDRHDAANIFEMPMSVLDLPVLKDMSEMSTDKALRAWIDSPNINEFELELDDFAGKTYGYAAIMGRVFNCSGFPSNGSMGVISEDDARACRRVSAVCADQMLDDMCSLNNRMRGDVEAKLEAELGVDYVDGTKGFYDLQSYNANTWGDDGSANRLDSIETLKDDYYERAETILDWAAMKAETVMCADVTVKHGEASIGMPGTGRATGFATRTDGGIMPEGVTVDVRDAFAQKLNALEDRADLLMFGEQHGGRALHADCGQRAQEAWRKVADFGVAADWHTARPAESRLAKAYAERWVALHPPLPTAFS